MEAPTRGHTGQRFAEGEKGSEKDPQPAASGKASGRRLPRAVGTSRGQWLCPGPGVGQETEEWAGPLAGLFQALSG